MSAPIVRYKYLVLLGIHKFHMDIRPDRKQLSVICINISTGESNPRPYKLILPIYKNKYESLHFYSPSFTKHG